jgi:hypothetical protein
MSLWKLFCCLALTFAVAACCNPPTSAVLPVPLLAQQESNWCWAASGQMIMNVLHPGSAVAQCDEANKEFGQASCCQNPGSNACNSGGWPQFDKYGFTFNTTADGTALAWIQVQGEIYCSGKPFAFSWHWPGGGGHMMVVIGYSTVQGVNYVSVNDPWPPGVGDQWVNTYDYFVALPGDHTHWRDYYNVAYP